jgi:hypothetical protein
MKISAGQQISDKDGYEAMLRFLFNFYEFTGSTDLTDILSGGEYIQADTPADPAFWRYWLKAIQQVQMEGPLPLKELRLPKRGQS